MSGTPRSQRASDSSPTLLWASGALLLMLLGGCSAPGPDDAPAPVASPAPDRESGAAQETAQEPAEATAEETARTAVVRLGPAEVTVSSAAVSAAPEGDVVVVAADLPVSVRLSGPGSLVVHADGSVTALDEAGTAVAGLAPPASPVPTRTTLLAPDHAEVAPTDATQAGSATLDGSATALTGATWGDREGGRSLAVEPTAWARGAGEAGLALLRAELGAAEPETATDTMRDQLTCHAVGARDKATWNLEPWRPDVGLVNVLAARCNP